MVTEKLQLTVLPHASVISKVFTVVPTGNAAPDPRPEICVMVTPPQLSDPVGFEYVITAVQLPESTLVVISEGQLMVGSVVSVTVMIWSQLIEFPLASIAVQVLVMISVFPQLALLTSLKLTEGLVSQLSVAAAVPVVAGEVSLPHATVTSEGQLIAGSEVSLPSGRFTGLLVQVSLQLASAES